LQINFKMEESLADLAHSQCGKTMYNATLLGGTFTTITQNTQEADAPTLDGTNPAQQERLNLQNRAK
jgi:hypothetical protein